MSNYTILEQNAMAGFEYDDTKELYLRGAQREEVRAFLMADAWEKVLRPFLHIAVTAATKILFDQRPNNPHLRSMNEMIDDVIAFARERHFRNHFPDGRKA